MRKVTAHCYQDKMVGPARIELAISHTPSADHTKLDHGPMRIHRVSAYSLNLVCSMLSGYKYGKRVNGLFFKVRKY